MRTPLGFFPSLPYQRIKTVSQSFQVAVNEKEEPAGQNEKPGIERADA
jgi:hypothetical protein